MTTVLEWSCCLQAWTMNNGLASTITNLVWCYANKPPQLLRSRLFLAVLWANPVAAGRHQKQLLRNAVSIGSWGCFALSQVCLHLHSMQQITKHALCVTVELSCEV